MKHTKTPEHEYLHKACNIYKKQILWHRDRYSKLVEALKVAKEALSNNQFYSQDNGDYMEDHNNDEVIDALNIVEQALKDTPAFPSTQNKSDIRGNNNEVFSKWHPGIPLRDYLAGQAISGILANINMDNKAETDAIVAYEIADAMLAQRTKEVKSE